jgi:hypothetical protein
VWTVVPAGRNVVFGVHGFTQILLLKAALVGSAYPADAYAFTCTDFCPLVQPELKTVVPT